MTFILILFFISLFGIAFMISKRVKLIRNGYIEVSDEISLLPNTKEIKIIITKNVKQYGFLVITIILRASIRSYFTVKKETIEMFRKIQNKFIKHNTNNINKQKEVSSFLKGISEYKRKISHLKNKIIEEEKHQ